MKRILNENARAPLLDGPGEQMNQPNVSNEPNDSNEPNESNDPNVRR